MGMMVYGYIAILYVKTQDYRYIVSFCIFSVFALQCNCTWSSRYIFLIQLCNVVHLLLF